MKKIILFLALMIMCMSYMSAYICYNVTITPSDAVYGYDANYSHRLTLNSGNTGYGNFSAGGIDLEFYNGSCSDNRDVTTKLNHYIQLWNTSSDSYVWVKTIDANTTKIHFIYSNDTAVDSSNKEGTFYFIDTADNYTTNVSVYNSGWKPGNAPNSVNISTYTDERSRFGNQSILLEDAGMELFYNFSSVINPVLSPKNYIYESWMFMNRTIGAVTCYQYFGLTTGTTAWGYDFYAQVENRYISSVYSSYFDSSSYTPVVTAGDTWVHAVVRVNYTGNSSVLNMYNGTLDTISVNATGIGVNSDVLGIGTYSAGASSTQTFFDDIIIRAFAPQEPYYTIVNNSVAPPNTAPTLTIDYPREMYHNNSANLTSRFVYTDAEGDNGNVSLYIDGVWNTSVDVINSQNTTISTTVNLSVDGNYTWFLQSCDLLACTNSSVFTYVFDNTLPLITWTSPFTAKNTELHNENNLTLLFTANDSYLYYINVSVYFSNLSLFYQVNYDNSTLNDSYSAIEGINFTNYDNYTIQIDIEDSQEVDRKLNNITEIVNYVYSSVPSLTVDYPEDNFHNNSANLTSRFLFSNLDTSGGNVSLFVNGIYNTSITVTDGLNTTIGLDVNFSTSGAYTWFLQACNNYLICSNTTTRTYNYDGLLPVITWNDPFVAKDTELINNTNLTLNISFSDLYLFMVNITVFNSSNDNITSLNYDNATVFNSFNLTYDFNFTYSDNYTIIVDVSDGVNNLSERVNYVYDTYLPTLSLFSPINGSIMNYTNINFSFNVSEKWGIKNCSLYIDGLLNQTNTLIIKDVRSGINTSLPDGNYTWYISCFSNSLASVTSDTLNISLQTAFNPIGYSSSGGGYSPSIIYKCNDGKDNDGDGLTDYPYDTGCRSLQDDDESDENIILSDENKSACDIEVTPLNIEFTNGNLLKKVRIKNNEMIQFVPTFYFSDTSGTSLSDNLFILNVPDKVSPYQEVEVAIKYDIGTFGNHIGNAEAIMVISSKYCKSKKVDIQIRVNESTTKEIIKENTQNIYEQIKNYASEPVLKGNEKYNYVKNILVLLFVSILVGGLLSGGVVGKFSEEEFTNFSLKIMVWLILSVGLTIGLIMSIRILLGG